MATDAPDLDDLVHRLLDDAGSLDPTALIGIDPGVLAAELRAAVAGLEPAEQRVRLAGAFRRLHALDHPPTPSA